MDGLSDYNLIVIPVFHSYLASLFCESNHDTADAGVGHSLPSLGPFVLTQA